MRILLINPPLLLSDRYGDNLGKLGPISEPMGLANVAAALETEGNEVEILDTEALNYTAKDAAIYYQKSQYDLVGVTITTPMFLRAKEVIEAIRAVDKDIRIIVGGPHPSIMPEETLRDLPEVQFAVIGEGEITVIELVMALEKGQDLDKVDGIAYRENDRIVVNSPRLCIKNLDDIPLPARHLLPMQMYRPTASYYRRLPSYLMVTSRGCPFHCVYCSQIFGRTYRYHSSQRVVAEMKLLIEKYGAREIIFRDDTFTLNQARVRRLCKEIINYNLHKRVKWSCATRVDCVSEDLLALMKASGCWGIHYGVESGSEKLLKVVEKGITLEQVRNAFKWSRKLKIETRAYFMVGLPGETKQDSEETIKFAIRLDPDWVQFTVTTPYPGTKLYYLAQKNGTLKSKKWENYQTWAGWADTDLVYVPEGRTGEEIKKLERQAMRRFYLRPKVFLRQILSLNSFTTLKKCIYGFWILLRGK